MPAARLFLLPRNFLWVWVSANSWEEIVAVDVARTRCSLWWQFPSECCTCTCATLLSCTRGKSIWPPWQPQRTDGAWGGSHWLVSLSRPCNTWNIRKTSESKQIKQMKKKRNKVVVCPGEQDAYWRRVFAFNKPVFALLSCNLCCSSRAEEVQSTAGLHC